MYEHEEYEKKEKRGYEKTEKIVDHFVQKGKVSPETIVKKSMGKK